MHSDNHQSIQYLVDIGRYNQAKQETQDLLHSDPNNIELLGLLATICWYQDDFEEGIEVAETGLSYSPDNEVLKHILFLLLLGDEQFEDSEVLIIDLIRNNPRNDDYFRGYAELMLYTFHLGKAKKLIAEAIRIAPDDASSQLIATLIDIADGKLTESKKKLEKLIKESPDDEHILRLLLLQLCIKKKHHAAMLLAQELLRRNPHEQELIDLIISLRTTTHWSAIPLWPVYRFGWVASIAMWMIYIVLVRMEDKMSVAWFNYVVWGYLGWCLYSWIHQPVFNRIFKSRGL